MCVNARFSSFAQHGHVFICYVADKEANCVYLLAFAIVRVAVCKIARSKAFEW